jgi:predicted DNA-binding helix-hairpin-helix protein
MQTADNLYQHYQLKRVYYSGYVPISNDQRLPGLGSPVPLLREHRLYQADWLLRFYGFDGHELVTPGGMLPLDVDPKLAWALAHPEAFPVDVNRAPREALLRVPGLGATSVKRLLAARRVRQLRRADIERLGTEARRVLCFVALPDHRPTEAELKRWVQARSARGGAARPSVPAQGDLFAAAADGG